MLWCVLFNILVVQSNGFKSARMKRYWEQIANCWLFSLNPHDKQSISYDIAWPCMYQDECVHALHLLLNIELLCLMHLMKYDEIILPSCSRVLIVATSHMVSCMNRLLYSPLIRMVNVGSQWRKMESSQSMVPRLSLSFVDDFVHLFSCVVHKLNCVHPVFLILCPLASLLSCYDLEALVLSHCIYIQFRTYLPWDQ